jgi:hypothetical protein
VAFFQGDMAVFCLLTAAFCGLWLAALARLWRERAPWERSGTDYLDRLGNAALPKTRLGDCCNPEHAESINRLTQRLQASDNR